MYKAHLFICVNGQENEEGKCASKGAADLHKKVKELCKNSPFNPDVRVNRSGCLGYCARGIATVLYPQNTWKLQMTKDSEQELFAAIKSSLETDK